MILCLICLIETLQNVLQLDINIECIIFLMFLEGFGQTFRQETMFPQCLVVCPGLNFLLCLLLILSLIIKNYLV